MGAAFPPGALTIVLDFMPMGLPMFIVVPRHADVLAQEHFDRLRERPSLAGHEGTWLAARDFRVLLDVIRFRRRSSRLPDVRDITIRLLDGNVASGDLRDVSRSGAAVETTARVAVGDRVVLGDTRVRVARLFEGGFAVQFARLLPL